jgi:putative protease
VPVITSRIRISEVKGDAPLVSDRGDSYHVAGRDGLTVVTAARPFSIAHFRGRLAQSGCSSFVADLTQVPAEHRKRLIEAISRGEQIRDTSEFNFSMGLV